MPHLWLILLLLSSSPASGQQTRWTLTTADFNSRQVDLAAIDDAGVKVRESSAAASPEQTIPWDNLLLIDRGSDPKPQTGAAGGGGVAGGGGKFVLYLAGGDQLRGEALKLDGETLQWQSPAVGAMGIPLRQVTALLRGSNKPAASVPSSPASPAAPLDAERRTEDVVQLANGDTVRGIVSDLSAETITVQSQGNPIPVPIDSIAAVLFASTAASAPPIATTSPDGGAAVRAFRIRLNDQSVMTATALQSAGDKLVVRLKGESTAAGAGRELPLASVEAIEQLDGPVSWLSSRTPSESTHIPLLETTRPARMDRTVTGRPIRFADRTYARGIGVAARSLLVWPIDPAAAANYAAFRTQYAIDAAAGGGAPYADVTVRIKLDDRVVHEKKNVIAGVLSPVVLVPLAKNSKTLTLEVDFGDNYGVQDRLNWIEPALIKTTAIPTAPAPAPRQPATTSNPTSDSTSSPTSNPASPRSGRDEVPPVPPATTRSATP